MSKFSELPKRALDTLIKTEKKIVTYPLDDKIKKFREKMQDLKENRELVVVDKYGNKYYQYYSVHGLPSRRVVVNNKKSFNKWDDDPIMLGWLQKTRHVAPTQEELEKIYIEQEEFARRGLEWDRKEKNLLEEWKKRNQEALKKEQKETNSIGSGDNFQPGSWDKIKKPLIKNIEETALTVQDQLVEVKEEEKRIIEGTSSIPGKYMVDFKAQDEKWMENKLAIRSAPYLEISKQIDWSKYTLEEMVNRSNAKTLEKRQEINKKQQQLTNLGKKMLEKKQTYQTYNNFRERFKDVFSDPKYSAL
jgi:hypothetical protein